MIIPKFEDCEYLLKSSSKDIPESIKENTAKIEVFCKNQDFMGSAYAYHCPFSGQEEFINTEKDLIKELKEAAFADLCNNIKDNTTLFKLDSNFKYYTNL